MLMAGDKNAIFVEVNKAIEAVMVKVRVLETEMAAVMVKVGVLETEVAVLKGDKSPKVKEKLDKS